MAEADGGPGGRWLPCRLFPHAASIHPLSRYMGPAYVDAWKCMLDQLSSPVVASPVCVAHAMYWAIGPRLLHRAKSRWQKKTRMWISPCNLRRLDHREHLRAPVEPLGQQKRVSWTWRPSREHPAVCAHTEVRSSRLVPDEKPLNRVV